MLCPLDELITSLLWNACHYPGDKSYFNNYFLIILNLLCLIWIWSYQVSSEYAFPTLIYLKRASGRIWVSFVSIKHASGVKCLDHSHVLWFVHRLRCTLTILPFVVWSPHWSLVSAVPSCLLSLGLALLPPRCTLWAIALQFVIRILI